MVENFVSDNLDHLKGRQRRDRIDEHVAMDADEMLAIQNRIFILFKLSRSVRCVIVMRNPHYFGQKEQ